MIKKLLVIMVGLLVPMAANAAVLDLTTGTGASGFYQGAYFWVPNTEVSGTGVFDPFVRIQGTGDEQGYNTDGTLEFDTKPGPWTHSITLGEIPTKNVKDLPGSPFADDVLCYEFRFDINETDNAKGRYLTLQDLEIYLRGAPDDTGYDGFGTPDYNLDPSDPPPGTDLTIGVKLNYSIYAGSGKLDMFAYIPISTLGGSSSDFLYLYADFGATDGSDDGFEEIGIIGDYPPPPPDGSTPEPGTLILLGSGLAGLAGYGKLRFRRKRS